MISSLNAYSGVSSSLLLKLFDTTPSSSPGTSTPAQPSVGDLSGSSSDPASAIRGILAESQIGGGLNTGGWSATNAAEAAYASQVAGSSAQGTNIPIAYAAQAQQIHDAIAVINNAQVIQQTTLDPTKNNGGLFLDQPITVSAQNAVNVTIVNGNVSVAAEGGASLPNGIPSIDVMQQQVANLKVDDEGIGYNGQEITPIDHAKETADKWWNSTFDGNFTLIQLPKGTLGAENVNFKVFDDGGNTWALVMSQKVSPTTAS